MVDRYDHCGVSGLTVGMKQTSDGDYVKYEDYKNLEAKNKLLKGLLKETLPSLKSIKKDVMLAVFIEDVLADGS